MSYVFHGEVQHVTKKPGCNTYLEVHVKKMFLCLRVRTYIHVKSHSPLFFVLHCCIVARPRNARHMPGILKQRYEKEGDDHPEAEQE